MKKVHLLLTAIIVSFGLYAQTTATKPTQGNGSEENPYQIENLAHLRWLSETNSAWDKYFIQTADIDAIETEIWNDGEGFSPIGGGFKWFTGSYNGNHKIISNLYINRPNTNYVGLFGDTYYATIEKLQLEQVDIEGKEQVGGVVGQSYESIRVYQTSVTGSIKGHTNVGAICGSSVGSNIKESFSNADIYVTDNYNGGIVGYNNFGTVENCYSLSVIHTTNNSFSGGIIGQNRYGDIINNYFAGTFTGDSNFKGGIISYEFEEADINVGNFWDSEKSEVAFNVGVAEPKTTAEMKELNTFIDAGWNFKLKGSPSNDIWNIGNGRNYDYPYLSWQYPNDEGLDIEADPIVRTVKVEIISQTEIEVSFAVDYVGNPIATEFGVCYGLNENPTLSDNTITSSDISEGNFSLITTDFEANKDYYFRAYAINDDDKVSYGNEISKFILIENIIEHPFNGEGSTSSPYEIATLDDLHWLSENIDFWDKHFIQTADIDAADTQNWNEGAGFSPIGNVTNFFTGSYDGQHFKIKNLFIDRFFGRQSLIGATDGAVIKRIIMEDASISGKDDAGGIVGRAINSQIIQCSFSGDLSGNYHVGGIVGMSDENLVIEECSSSGNISSLEHSVGGIVGYGGGEISNSYSSGNIDGPGRIGGIIGTTIFDYATIENCHFFGILNKDKGEFGAIVGYTYRTPTVNNSFYDNEILDAPTKLYGTALTTGDMISISTYTNAGWEINTVESIWDISPFKNRGYPYLKWQILPDEHAEFFIIIKSVTINTDLEVEVVLNLLHVESPENDNIGVCYATNPTPTVNDSKVNITNPVTTGEHTIVITGLEENETYYLRTYTENNETEVYGRTIIVYVAIETEATEPLGNGSTESPYEIENLTHLRWLSENSNAWNKHFIQTADIDAAETINWNKNKGFSPIGNNDSRFKGSYNGNYHKIENLIINRSENNYIGLFGYTENATIEKILIENSSIEGNERVGGVVGNAYNSTIYQTSVTGTISGNNYIGGITGYNNGGTINESFSNADTYTNRENNGGIVGANNNGTIENCYSLSVIHTTSSSSSGGIIGYNSTSSSVVSNNYFAGSFNGPSSNKGGVIGWGSTPITDVGNFWDREKSGVTRNIGVAINKTTAEMTNANTFIESGWAFKLINAVDYGIWNIGNSKNNGYPYLNWQNPSDDALNIEAKPIVKTLSIEATSQTELEVSLSVVYVGNPIATEFGVCYGLNENTTADDNIVISSEEISEGEFTITVSGLENNELYYFRAYATINNIDFAYGEEMIFTIPYVQKPAGEGTEEEPYLISNFEELLWISNNSGSWDKHFVQTADIDASISFGINSGAGFTPIGNNINAFTGTYNGNYNKIQNLTIHIPEVSYVGLFGYIENATIEKLIIENSNIEGYERVAGIAGHTSNSTIYQTAVTGSLSGYSYIGGITGYNTDGIISESFSEADIYTNNENNGGIVGANNNGTIENCYSLSVIHTASNSSSGGIIGYNRYSDSVIRNNYFAGSFNGSSSFKGGIIGWGNTPTTNIENFWDRNKAGSINNYTNCGEGKSTEEMTNVNTFLNSDWEFKLTNTVNNSIWNIGNDRNGDYPYLDWQYPNDLAIDAERAPIVKTDKIKAISQTELEVTFTVDYVGNPIATEYGVCYSSHNNPTVEDFVITSNTDIKEAEFTLTISDLEDDKTYYFRAFANNSNGTSYGEIIEFYLPVNEEPNGSEEKPYQISTLEDLKWLSENDQHWDKHFIQTADINATETATWNGGKGFSPIGNYFSRFTGSYNGDYHTIENLYMNNPDEEHQGLFGYASDAYIEKLTLVNAIIEGGTRVGGIAGNFSGTIIQTSVSGSVKGYANVGGICGYNTGSIKESYSEANIYGISSMADIGGIVGINYDGTVENNYSNSNLYADDDSRLGGIMGYNWFGNVINNYFAGTFSGGSTNRGGINQRGRIYDTESTNFWDKEVTGVDNNSEQAKTTAEMKDINTFLDADWDFGDDNNVGIWSINSGKNDGYPYLSWMSDIVSVNIKSVINNSNISVTPNPFNDVVNITGSGINRIKAYTISGIQMLDAKYNNESEITIPTSDFDKGIYLFVIENVENIETYKLIKK